MLTKVQVILLTLGFSAEDYSPTLGSITINRLVLFPACLGIFKCDFVCNKYSLALLCTTIYCYFGARANTLLLPLDSAYTCTDPYCQVLVLQCCCWFQTDFFFLWSDTFQLVSVKLTKGAGQDLESKELSVVLGGVGASMKHIAFGREVCSPLGFFLLWDVGWVGFFSSQINSVLFMPLYKAQQY